ncbi:MAG TPA: hypothetical protein ENI13_02005 [candidate division CPR3 bacterium]|uniref:Uncharacterized protein n=1 Tax=candidate division CPR3 bacterium TaxID=2268181 RepID=A0A7C1NMM1_UNCC3|nr:hypothetical protein [candidate division CPR3 bacterium]
MVNEEKLKVEEEIPPSPSEEETLREEPPKEEIPKVEPPETTNYKAEFEKKEKELEEKEKEANRLGFQNRKMKKKLDDEGIEFEENEPGGLSEDSVRDIVDGAVDKRVKPLEEELTKTKAERDEALRVAASRANLSTGGGDGGQKLPVVVKPPPFSELDRKLMASQGITWDVTKIDPETGQKGVFTDKHGKIYPLVYKRTGDVRSTTKAE